MRLWITGSGIVSALGVGREATLQSLLATRSGIGPVRYLDTELREFPVGEVPLSDAEMETHLQVPVGAPTTRAALLGMMALEEALASAGISRDELPRVAFVSGTTVGGMDKTEKFYLDFLENDKHNQYIATHDCGACTEMIADHFGHFASVATLSTACSSAANAVIYGARLIEVGVADVVVAGGTECLTRFHLAGFNSLRILDTLHCRPFDGSRAGLNLGEGAAYLVLESEAHAIRRGAKAEAFLDGYGNACDAWHQTASSPDGRGAFRAMRQALSMAGLKPTDISYVNAHGTGTPSNDSSESAAMQRLFGDQLPLVSSTKPFTGHTTSASGAIESVICILAMQNSFVPPNLNFTSATDCIVPVSQLRCGVDLHHVLCNSFGFGGNDSSLLFTRCGVGPSAECKIVGPASTAEKSCSARRRVYIRSAEHISAQEPFSDKWMDDAVAHDQPYVRSADPDFKPFVPPTEARRMGKLLKRALAVSKESLRQAAVDMPDIVVTGTGLGCLENTQLFLEAMCREGEHLLKPTHFMQSTHNTVSSLVAIQIGSLGYNATYAHKNISFELALHDAMMQIRQGNAKTALVGAHDEMTPSYYNILCKTGCLGREGQMASECSAAFVIGAQAQAGSLCEIVDISLLYCPDVEMLKSALIEILSRNDISLQQVAAVLTGFDGSVAGRRIYLDSFREIFGRLPILHFKHLFGEGYSSSALSLYVAARCLARNRFPQSLFLASSKEYMPAIDTVRTPALLLYNADDQKNHSLMLLRTSVNGDK